MSNNLPTKPHEITVEWLNKVLQHSFPGVEISKIEMSDLQVGTNSNVRLHLEFDNQAGAPESIFIKLPPQEQLQRELVKLSGMGRREASFYSRLAEYTPMQVPDSYFSSFDENDGAFIMLIEDLAHTGCTFPNGVEGVSLSFGELAMDDFAALHARFQQYERLQLDLSWVEPPLRTAEYGAGMLKYGLEISGGNLAGDFVNMAQLYIDHFDAIHDLWEEDSWTIVHGDTHVTNLFEDSGRPGYFDWGLFSTGEGIRDVSYFISMSLSVELRRKHQKELIERYLAKLAELGGPEIPFSKAWELYRRHCAYTVAAACQTLVKDTSDPDYAYSQAFLNRACAVISDTEATAVIKSELGL